jgi:hypothetical protein
MLWAGISIRARCTTLCDKVCQWLAASQWFSPCTPHFTRHFRIKIISKVGSVFIFYHIVVIDKLNFKNSIWRLIQTRTLSYNISTAWDKTISQCLFVCLLTRKMLRKFSNDITTFYDVYEPKLSTIFIDILVFCYFSTLSSAQLKYFCFALKYK